MISNVRVAVDIAKRLTESCRIKVLWLDCLTKADLPNQKGGKIIKGYTIKINLKNNLRKYRLSDSST